VHPVVDLAVPYPAEGFMSFSYYFFKRSFMVCFYLGVKVRFFDLVKYQVF